MGDLSELVEVIIEIPKGSRNKYEYDAARSVIRLDRVLFSSVHYPADYGFIPDTLAPDGDTLDALVLVEVPTFPGCHIEVRPVGLLLMRDEHGEDHKILAVPASDPRYNEINDLKDVAPHWMREIANFFSTYKLLEDKESETLGWEGAAAAAEFIDRCRREFKKG